MKHKLCVILVFQIDNWLQKRPHLSGKQGNPNEVNMHHKNELCIEWSSRILPPWIKYIWKRSKQEKKESLEMEIRFAERVFRISTLS